MAKMEEHLLKIGCYQDTTGSLQRDTECVTYSILAAA